jgi:hypothetical protein
LINDPAKEFVIAQGILCGSLSQVFTLDGIPGHEFVERNFHEEHTGCFFVKVTVSDTLQMRWVTKGASHRVGAGDGFPLDGIVRVSGIIEGLQHDF